MTKEDAIKMAESGWWKDRPDSEVAEWQLNETRLCMDFSDFHKAVEGALERLVWTHEFRDPERLLRELHGDDPKPENYNQHALDSLAAMMLAKGRNPDKTVIPVVMDP